jgi:2-methylcitrate dehydratase PrpD
LAEETTTVAGTALLRSGLGVAAGVGRIYGFDERMMNHALSVADFNAPLVPGIRSVEYPSMNKDGVPFGVMIGMLAVKETECGFTGNKNLLEADDYRHLVDDLGKNYEILSLYFKPYPCCRWAHPAIDACIHTMRENGIRSTDIERVIIHTFHRATLLSKIEPKSADDAQYNIAYPVATAIVHGDFSIEHVKEEAFEDKEVLAMMKKLSFVTNEELDAKFPQKRICRAQIITKAGQEFLSSDFEPSGEADENIGLDWLCKKFHRIAACVLNEAQREEILSMILGNENLSVRDLIEKTNSFLV